MISLFRHRNFLLFLGAQTTYSVGAGLGWIALPLLAVTATEAGPSDLAALLLPEAMATLLFLLPAGVWIDRLSHRSVLVNTALAQAVLTVTVPIAWWAEALSPLHLQLAGIGSGIASAFGTVAWASYLPRIVDADRLLPANAALSTAAEVQGLALHHALDKPLDALFRSMSASAGPLLKVLAMLASALLVRRIDVPEEAPDRAARRPLLRELGAGVGFLLSRRDLRGLVIAGALGYFCLLVLSTVYGMLAVAWRFLGEKQDPAAHAWLIGGEPLGALAGALVAWPLARRLGGVRTAWLPLVVTQPFLLLIPFVPDDWPALLHLAPTFVQGAGFTIAVIAQTSYLQREIPDGLRGRVLAVQVFLSTLATIPAPFAGAVLSETFTEEPVIMACGVSLTLAGVIAWRALSSPVSDTPRAEAEGVDH
ncbi:MFS transporter [Planomonospora sp. ID67723]|uniref:MFS transporter n=1 Tax=Planomonospora sp. ID67723 TaxID=2738134 RepID=UPI0018C44053|nr:MFS transporter [Planomonospora sp. ID67723]MBG0830899.1 MFS transporter [Planomonospora sp. ID67723]